MQILEIGVRNFRSISNDPGVQVELGRLIAIAGANDSGKTSFLLGVYLGLMGLFGFPKGRDILYHRYIGGLNKHYSPNSLVENTEPTMVRVKILMQRNDLEKYLSGAQSWHIRGRQIPFAEFLDILSGVECVFNVNVDALFNEHGQVNKDSIGLEKWFNSEQTVPSIADKLKAFATSPDERDPFASDLISNFQKQMKWEYIPGEVLYLPAERYIDLSNWNSTQQYEYKHLVDFRLGVEPRELLQYISSLEAEGNERKYRKFIALLQLLYPIDEVRIKPTPFGPDIFIIQNGRSQPLSRSGTGLAQIMYICARILETSNETNTVPKIVIFDEPETGLHPGLQRSLTGLMKVIAEMYHVQWLLGSHSPFIFREIDFSGGDLLWSITHNGHHSDSRPVHHSSAVQELYTSIGIHLPSILTAKAVIFCEGISEANFLPTVLQKSGVDVSSVVIVPLGGIGNFKHIAPMDLQSLHPNCILILDWDEGDSADNRARTEFINSGMTVYCNRDYRTLENSYFAEAFARVYKCATIPQIEPFDRFSVIQEKLQAAGAQKQLSQKSKLAQKIAEAMTESECMTHPLVQSISDWLRNL